MDSCGYRIIFEPDGNYRNVYLYVSRSHLIGKYMRHLPFVYEEYDGCVFLADDAEKDQTYKKYTKDNSRPLSVKAKLREELSIGDKTSLWYHGKYEIRLDPKRTLTKEYATELAKEFCA